jgi:superfamily II DNA helicase RecQ
MCLEDTRFSKLLQTPEFTQNVLSIVIDEAHCVSEWGENFRKAFSELGRLRFYVPGTIPFLVTSATLPTHILDNVVQKLHISKSRSVFINLGNDCPNITHVVCRMHGAKSDLAALDFVVDEASTGGPLIKTIIFFESCQLAYKGYKHLQQLLPSGLWAHITFLHSFRSTRSKRIVMSEFRSGAVDILCATEAAGMVSRLCLYFSHSDSHDEYRV